MEVSLGIGAELRIGSTVLRLEKGEERSEIVARRGSFGGLIGTSEAMQEVYGVLTAVAPSDSTVLIEGETGTGKEVVAEELHRQSSRRSQSFAVLDCGSLPPGLIESELFGHERGAFTGAETARDGVFERARGGTVFLDEIGELPLEMQPRLLRVLDQRTVRRVGSNLQRRIDVRLIAATNRDLAEEVKQGRFRQDLYYRLAVVRIKLPPLRRRRDDIAILARHFLQQAGCADPEAILTPELLSVLQSRKWPGNVRELRNVIERSVLLVDGSPLRLSSVSAADESSPRESATEPSISVDPGSPAEWLARCMPRDLLRRPYKEAKQVLVGAFETLYLGRLIQDHGCNISRIANDAEVDRQLVRKLLRKHGLEGHE
jgi:DNA-binding NtrC family response regulator